MLVDFLIGLFAVNALPHYLFGRLDTGVLSLFGFSAKGNLLYAGFCLTLSIGLFAYKYGLGAPSEHMIFDDRHRADEDHMLRGRSQPVLVCEQADRQGQAKARVEKIP
ncbi:MAG: hypothetical protein AAF581_05870, partial [Planctomycetota bacterium]